MAHGSTAGGPTVGTPQEVVRARRIEVVDEEGTARILLGRLGDGDGALFGVSVRAAVAGTGVDVTADDAAAGLGISRRGEALLDAHVHGRDSEAPAAIDVGPGDPAISVEVAADGAVTVRLRGVRIERRAS